MYLIFCLQYTLWNILSGCSSQLIVATLISQQNHIKWKVFWQLYFTVLLDVAISSNIQNNISKNYWWSLHFTSDIRVELSNPQVLLADMVINYSLPLLHKKFGKPLRFCCSVCNGFANWFFAGRKILWRIKMKKPSANVFGKRQTCSIPTVNWDKKRIKTKFNTYSCLL